MTLIYGLNKTALFQPWRMKNNINRLCGGICAFCGYFTAHRSYKHEHAQTCAVRQDYSDSIMTKEKYDIIQWLNQLANKETLFLSVHFDTPPENKNELIHRCQPIFRHLFKHLIGRRWNKFYKNYFTLLGVQEYGYFCNIHAHFILVCKAKFDAITVLNGMIALSHRIKMDIFRDATDKATHPKCYQNDIMIKQMYSCDVMNYMTKEFKINGTHINDTIILDTDLFN